MQDFYLIFCFPDNQSAAAISSTLHQSSRWKTAVRFVFARYLNHRAAAYFGAL